MTTSRVSLVVVLLSLGATACTPSRGVLMEGLETGQPARKQTLLFYTTSSTNSPHKGVLPLVFATAAKEKGHDAILFLAGDGVLLMKDSVAADIKAVGQPGAAELLKKAVELKVPIHV